MSTEENTKLLVPRPEMRIRGAGLAFPVPQSGVSQRENPDGSCRPTRLISRWHPFSSDALDANAVV
jgi:hypothetical protein